jgi:hypothetical protein
MRRYVAGTAVICVLAGIGLLAATSHGPSIKDGDVLGPSNWQAASNLLPDEILEHYRRGEYRNQVMDIERPSYLSIHLPPDFQAASRANRGRYRLDAYGAIVDATTDGQPRYIMGFPFPDVTATDPEAATKIVWNHLYANWYRGNCHFLTELVLLGRGGIERRVMTDVRMLMYDGAPEASGQPNPHNLFQQTMAEVVSPADLNGTVSLTWRYRDPRKPDSVWSYVPGQRRPRQVSPLNRSDGFLGSDLSLDDGPFFDGKPADFTFRVIAKTEQLVLMDPYSVRGEAEIVGLEEGGWRIIWKDVPRIGADDPDWDGLPWAPVSSMLARRPVWVIEATPKDPNYQYGRVVLRLDAETYHGSWASKYDRAGELVTSYQVSTGAHYPAEHAGGQVYVSAGGIAVQTAENLMFDRATVVLFPPRNPDNPADYHVPFSPQSFTLQALSRLGR